MTYFHMLRKRLITLGIKPQESRALANKFNSLVKTRGELGTLEYLKRCGDAIISYHSRTPYQGGYVKLVNGYPNTLLCVKAYPIEVQLRIAKMARVICLSNPTPSMVSKLVINATAPSRAVAAQVIRAEKLIKMGLSQYSLSKKEFEYRFKSVNSQSRTYYSKSVPTGTEVGLDLSELLQCFKQSRSQITVLPNWEQAIYPIHPFWWCTESDKAEKSNFVGKIGGVMENGGKLRMFAAPNVLLQSLLEPLQNWLDSFREQIPNDVFKHQEEGAIWAQNKMKNGLEIQSIDLSSATCRFPYSLQRDLCLTLGAPKDIIDLYDHVASGTWEVMRTQVLKDFPRTIQWAVGQPLGVNPSMSSFALCHTLLLAGLSKEIGLDVQDSFRVMGDDVVTCNQELAKRYRRVIAGLGIEISEHKSYNSKIYSEFAGFSITPNALVRPGRWRAPSDLNVLGLISDLGDLVINEMKEDKRFFLKVLAFKEGTFSPPVHEWTDFLRISTSLFTSEDEDVVHVKHRLHEVSWYEGVISQIRKQHPECFFLSDKSENWLNHFKGPIAESVRRKVAHIYDSSIAPIWITGLLEHEASLVCDAQGYIDYIARISEQYEAYLWTIPYTDGRLSREKTKLIRGAYIRLTEKLMK